MKKVKLIKTITALGSIAAATPVVVTGCSSTTQDFKTITMLTKQIYPNALDYPVEVSGNYDFDTNDFAATVEKSDEIVKITEVTATSDNDKAIKITNNNDKTGFTASAGTEVGAKATVKVTIKSDKGKQGTGTINVTLKEATPVTPVVKCTQAKIGGVVLTKTLSSGDQLPAPIIAEDWLDLTLADIIGAKPTWKLYKGETEITKGILWDTQGETTSIKFTDPAVFAAGNEEFTIVATNGDDTYEFNFITAASEVNALYGGLFPVKNGSKFGVMEK